LVTGGKDGNVRIWGRANRGLVTQLELHTNSVTRLLEDSKDAGLIHSCSLDKDITSYSLKKEKKVISHRAANGFVTDMVQKKSSEFELSKPRLTE
jgi:WD40 repeat protein